MRLQSNLWVSAYIRQVATAGAFAMQVRRGEASAGAIYIKVNYLDRSAKLYSPAPSFMAPAQNELADIDRVWHSEFGDLPQMEQDIDQFVRQQAEYDGDIWLIEVEDREGRHFLGDQLISLDHG